MKYLIGDIVKIQYAGTASYMVAILLRQKNLEHLKGYASSTPLWEGYVLYDTYPHFRKSTTGTIVRVEEQNMDIYNHEKHKQNKVY